MKKFAIGLLLSAGAIIGASLIPHQPLAIKPAKANVTVMCAPQLADTAAARTIGQSVGGGSQSTIPSGSIYTLNGQGCTIAKQQDLGWFLSQGFSPGPPFGSNIIFTTGVATSTTAFQIGVLPPNAYIQHIIAVNSTANAVTGGIAFGTTANGTQIDATLACGANCVAFAADTAITRIPNSGAGTPIYAAAVTTWNSANVTITVVYGYY